MSSHILEAGTPRFLQGWLLLEAPGEGPSCLFQPLRAAGILGGATSLPCLCPSLCSRLPSAFLRLLLEGRQSSRVSEGPPSGCFCVSVPSLLMKTPAVCTRPPSRLNRRPDLNGTCITSLKTLFPRKATSPGNGLQHGSKKFSVSLGVLTVTRGGGVHWLAGCVVPTPAPSLGPGPAPHRF